MPSQLPLSSLVLATCLGTAASAQDLTPKAAPQHAPIVLTNATIHPVVGETITDGVLYFTDGIIRGVLTREQWAQVQATALWKQPPLIIDLTGKHIYPALIAPYTQLGLTEIQAVAATQDLGEVGSITPEVKACVAINPDSTLLPVTRRNGVLIAGVFPVGGLVPGQACAARLDGWTTRDIAIVSRAAFDKPADNAPAADLVPAANPDANLPSAGLVLRWPNVRPITAWWMERSEDDQLKDIRRELDEVKRVLETAKNYARARASDPAQPIDLRWEAMAPLFARESNAAQLPLFVLAQDADQIASAVDTCAQLGLRCVIVGGRDAALVSQQLKKHDVGVIVQGVQNMPRRDDSPINEPFTLPALLAKAGVRFAIASNDDTAHERNLPYTVGTAVAHGLSHDAALRAITLTPAQLLGIADRYGSLEVGKSATLIVTTGDPLEVTTDVGMAFVDGRQLDMSNKQTKLAEKYLERYRQTGDIRADAVKDDAPPAPKR